MTQKGQKSDEYVDLPYTAYELIEMLDRAYPPRCILLGETPESAHRYAGRRAMIDELVEAMTAEKESALEAAADGGSVHRRPR